MFGKQYKIECIMLIKGNQPVTVYWEEGPVEAE
jgi:hypothetical protein